MGLVDVDGLKSAMMESYTNEDLRKKLGSNARQFAIENLDWEIIVDQTEKILSKAANTKHPLGKHSTMGMGR